VRYVVFNPGSHPAPRWIAARLSDQSDLESYWTSFQISGRVASGRMYRAIPRFVRRSFANRILPPSLDARAVRRAAALLDFFAGTVLQMRGGSNLRNRLLQRRNRIVARNLRKHLLRLVGSGTAVTVIIPTDTRTGIEDSCFSLGIPYVLYTPLPDARYCAELLTDDEVTSPRWSEFLGDKPTTAERGHADRYVLNSRAVIANSDFTVRSFERFAGNTAMRSVPLAVDLGELRRQNLLGTAVRNRRGPEEPLRIAYAGQINQRKGLSYLFEAVDSLIGLGQIHIQLYGTDHLGMLPSLARDFPNIVVNHRPRLPQSELWLALARDHLFAFPTLLDGFGNALAEAAAIGLPSIVTDRCGAPDLGLIPTAAVLVPAQDSRAIAAAIEGFYTDENRRLAFAAEATKIMSRGRSWDEYGADAVTFVRGLS